MLSVMAASARKRFSATRMCGHVLPDDVTWHWPLVVEVIVQDIFCLVCFLLRHFFGAKRSQLLIAIDYWMFFSRSIGRGG